VTRFGEISTFGKKIDLYQYLIRTQFCSLICHKFNRSFSIRYTRQFFQSGTRHWVKFETFGSLFKNISGHSGPDQGCQMVCFQSKNPNLGKFWRALNWKKLIYFVAIWNILLKFGMFYSFGTICVHLVHFSCFGIMHQEKSGNPCPDAIKHLLQFSN
jgi:hypothetical protein